MNPIWSPEAIADLAALRAYIAQDDPAALSDILTNSALRNSPDIVTQNVEAALAADDADLANSFVELAAAKNIPLPEDLSRQVTEAVAEENSASHFAKRFATGLVNGTVDDVASLSGTVAGDLFVFGDIRDVVREGKHLAMGEDTDHLILGLAAAGLAHVPENRLVFPTLPVDDNLTLGGWTRRRGPRAEMESQRQRALDLFPRLQTRRRQPADVALVCRRNRAVHGHQPAESKARRRPGLSATLGHLRHWDKHDLSQLKAEQSESVAA